MFSFNTEIPDEFKTAHERLGQPYKVLQNGQHLPQLASRQKKIEVLSTIKIVNIASNEDSWNEL